MLKRNLTRFEKKTVAQIAPNLNLKNWLIRKKTDQYYLLEHKQTGTKKSVPI